MVAEKKKENKGKGDKRQREGEDEDREAPPVHGLLGCTQQVQAARLEC